MDISYWIDSTKETNYPSLGKDIETDICIVGGGLVSAVTAYLLTKVGKQVTVLERNKVGLGVTSNSTAKLTSQHGLFYDYLYNEFGFDFARKYLHSNQEAISLAEKIISEENIDCDFEKQDNYVFTTSKQEAEKIVKEVEIVKKLGLDAEYLTEIPLPLNNILAAIRFPNQAQLHIRKYLISLFKIIQDNGNQIFEHSKVMDVEKNADGFTVFTEHYKVSAKQVIIASHYPIINFPGFYFLKMYQGKSYIIAVDTHEELFSGMYISSHDPITSFRTVPYQDTRLLLVAGSDHKTGANDVSIEDSYSNLENYIKSIYPKSQVKYRWSTEDCITLDKVPYIGQYSHLLPNMYVATGFKKWGISGSHVAARILTDSILGKENTYSSIYNSTRINPIKNAKEMGNMLKESTYSLIINKTRASSKTLEDISLDSGDIIDYHGQKLGVYKDKEGKIHAVKPYCSHLGCELTWNNLEKTWDCPCHGSRYDYTGKIITEPTTRHLETIELDKE